MSSEKLAVKSFIVNDNKLLIIKRTNDDIQKPGIWEIPGGRIDKKEDLIKGLIREVKEETNLDIKVIKPLNFQEFIRDDKQKIKMTIFLCKALNNDVKLSKEHTNFEWIYIDDAKNKLTDFFHEEIDIFKKEN